MTMRAEVPALITQSAEILELPDEMLRPSIVLARPALELQAFRDGLSVETPEWVSEAPYETAVKGALRRHENGRVEFVGKDEELGTTKTFIVGPDALIGRVRTDVTAKIDVVKALALKKVEAAEAHPIGIGGLLLDNAFGGIDVNNVPDTAKHLLLRTLLARHTKLTTVDELVKAGQLDPVLGELMGNDIAEHMSKTNLVLAGYEELLNNLSEDEARLVGAASLTGVLLMNTKFIDLHARTIVRTAHIVSDPELAERVLGAHKDAENNNTGRSSSTGSQLNARIDSRV